MAYLREKVIRGLACLSNPFMQDADERDCEHCSYDSASCFLDITSDALSLLKAQEPVTPYIDYDGQDVWRCGSCGATLFHLSHTQADENEQNFVKFCRHCGKAVKWND